MVRSVFDVVKAPLGWSVFADNVKIAGVYDSRGAALEAAALAASYAVSDGVGVQINVPGAEEEKPKWATEFETSVTVLTGDEVATEPQSSENAPKQKAGARF
jgi:hypothetical protein